MFNSMLHQGRNGKRVASGTAGQEPRVGTGGRERERRFKGVEGEKRGERERERERNSRGFTYKSFDAICSIDLLELALSKSH